MSYIQEIGEERWEEMSEDERFDALHEALKEYLERGIGDARYQPEGRFDCEMLILCVDAMFTDLVTQANFRWWSENAKDYGVCIYGHLTPMVCIDRVDTLFMSYDQAFWLEDVCDKLLEYPIIDEQIYSDMEMDAFDYVFNETYCEAGELAPEWQDIGLETMRELAWDNGHVECDYFWIDEDKVENQVAIIRMRRDAV